MSVKSLSVLLVAVVSFLSVGSSKTSAQSTQSVTVAWNPSSSSNVTGYIVHYGTASGSYSYTVDAGQSTNAIISGLLQGTTYFFTATAYDDFGNNSDPSNEISYQIPTTPVVPPTITMSSPTVGDSFTAPATITLAANVVTNGHAITKVQFYSGSTFLGETTVTPFSYGWTTTVAGTYSVFARLIYDSGSTVDSVPVSISVLPASVQWQLTDLGTVSLQGSVSFTNDIWTVKGAGTLGGTADNLTFAYQALSADGELRAQINAVGQTGSSARIGIMIRETLASGARCIFLGISPDGTYRWARRTKTSSKVTSSNAGTAVLPNAWVRLVRTGNTIYGYKSSDGVTWTSVGSQSVSMAANVYFGLVVASGSTSTLNTSAFSNVLLVP